MVKFLIKKAIRNLAKKELLKRKKIYEVHVSEEKIPPITAQNFIAQPEFVIKKEPIPITIPEIIINKKYIPLTESSIEERKRIKKTEGVALSYIFTDKYDVERIKTYTLIDKKPYEHIHLKYPLIVGKIENQTVTLAWAEIKYVPEKHSLVYFVHEPEINNNDRKIIEKTIKALEEKIDIDFYSLKNPKAAYDYINKLIDEIWKFYGIKYNKEKALKVKYYIFRDTIGLGKIEPLMHDPNIEDISCDGVGIPVFVFHRNPMIGEIQTNIVFETDEELDSFVMKLAQKCGRAVSVAQPLFDGSLPDGSRVQIVYGKDISRKGSSFTIRKFSKEPLTPVHLIKFGTADVKIFTYLWAAVETQHSILIAGGTATGKTTFLNAIAMFIKPEMKIVSIEDTPELQLVHPNWLQEVARPAFGPSGYGAVEMVDLLKAALRQRPDYIIVGEVRGQEAYVMFQAMATGHPALGTIHAENLRALVDRLISPPINLPPVLLENLDIVVFLVRTKVGNTYVRRVTQIVEITGYNREKNDVTYNKVFEWDPSSDSFKIYNSVILKEIKEFKGYTDDELKADLNFKARILKWLTDKNITNYKEFTKYIEMYYLTPEKLAEIIKQ